MAISRSLSIGSSSLRAHQQRFDLISNNLANLNTVGFKGNRANFTEHFNQVNNYGRSPETTEGIGTGASNPIQFGLGVKLGSISQDMSQGTLETTNRALDLAIQGEGFFIYNLNGQQMYSRAGNISVDRNFNLVDSSTGALLQGYAVRTETNGSPVRVNGVNQLQGTISSLNIPENVTSPPNQTQLVKMTGNLNANNPDGAEKVTSISIYDNVGGVHELKMTFAFVAGDPAAVPPTTDGYNMSVEIDGNAVGGTTQLTFNSDGTINTPTSLTLTHLSDPPAASDLATLFPGRFSSDVVVQLADPNQITSGLTNYAGANSVTFTQQDGYQSGGLIDLSVDGRGQIWGAFTNGKSELLGQVALAKFTNQEGLTRNGNNFYREAPNSGIPNIGTALDIFPSTQIAGNALEQSNVDMTTQFTDMISTQRAYEAAARTITLSDQLLNETTNLKR